MPLTLEQRKNPDVDAKRKNQTSNHRPIRLTEEEKEIAKFLEGFKYQSNASESRGSSSEAWYNNTPSNHTQAQTVRDVYLGFKYGQNKSGPFMGTSLPSQMLFSKSPIVKKTNRHLHVANRKQMPHLPFPTMGDIHPSQFLAPLIARTSFNFFGDRELQKVNSDSPSIRNFDFK